MKKLFNKENITKILMIFLIIQPIIDIYVLFEDKVVNFFGFSPATIIRIIGIALLAILTILFIMKFKKVHIWFILYGILIVLYAVLHHVNATNFTSLVEGNFNYSLVSELFYIIRMLMPLAMIVISYYLPMNDSKLNKVISWLVILISGSIVITNLFEIGLGSYSKKVIAGNIFIWVTDNYQTYNYLQLATKGFFNDPNRIAALLVLITPILFYCFIKKPTKLNITLIFVQLFGMFMLGTKVSTYGFVGIICATLIIYYFFVFIKKEFSFNSKINGTIIIAIVLCFILLPYCPAINRTNVDNKMYSDYENNINDQKKKNDETINKVQPQIDANIEIINTTDYKEILKKDKASVYLEGKTIIKINKEISDSLLIPFIKKNYKNFSINPIFILESYPYQSDPYFWYNIMKLPISIRTNFRYIEQAMLDRVKEVNGKIADNWLGITFTRIGNIFDLEKDFISHYYSLGIVGLILLLSPYIIIPLICGILMLTKYKKHLNLKNTMLMLSIGITLFAGFYSGNVMDGLIVTLILGFIIGSLLENIFNNKKTDKKISIIIPTYNDSKTITETLDSVKKQTISNWEIVVVDDGSTDNTKEVIEKYINKNQLNEKIKYIYEENKDQLNAVLNGSNYITGDYILILHSDDLLGSNCTLKETIDYFNNNDCDAIIGNLKIIDKNGKYKKTQKVNNYHISKNIPPLQLLWLGRNLYLDTAVFKKEIFFKDVKENYLTWNMPFWLSYHPKPKMLNVKKIDFSLIKYRVFEENYINNELGKLNVINGELRTACNLMKYYDIPNYEKQYKTFRIFNKLHLLPIYKVKYNEKETNNKVLIIDFILNKRISNYLEYPYFEALYDFYKNKQERTITIKINEKGIYYGSDMRTFNKKMLNNSLDKMYYKIFEEMKKGFNKIKVNTKDYNNAIILTKFLGINNDIEIIEE